MILKIRKTKIPPILNLNFKQKKINKIIFYYDI